MSPNYPASTRSATASFETLQKANDELRHRPGGLTILDLPDELLLYVLELAEDTAIMSPGLRERTEVVQNIRLVCRRFCALGSRLLVRRVQVALDEQSLAHLDEVSRHPGISKGVRIVEIHLGFYNPSLSDFSRFLSYHADALESRANEFEYDSPDWETAGEMTQNARAVVSTLRRLAIESPNELSADDQAARRSLLEIHQEYLVRLEKQNSSQWRRHYLQTVNTAVSKMPFLRGLHFSDDHSRFYEPSMVTGDRVWDSLCRRMLHRTAAWEARKIPTPTARLLLHYRLVRRCPASRRIA
ncbi:hypothetical protein VTK26DRAFT_2114 [Humicola hyalothermophila]